MTRIFAIAALAAVVALPASAETIRVSAVGKTPAQLKKDIAVAARQLCREELSGSNSPVSVVETCVRTVVYNTMTDPQNAKVALLKPLKVAQR